MCTLEEKEKESKMRTQTVRYRVYEEWITHPQLGRYCCYGIVCESYLPKHGWQLQQAVSDITDDRNAAEALAALMQQEDLEPGRLRLTLTIRSLFRLPRRFTTSNCTPTG